MNLKKALYDAFDVIYFNIYYYPKFDYHTSYSSILSLALFNRVVVIFFIGVLFKVLSEISLAENSRIGAYIPHKLANVVKKLLGAAKWITWFLSLLIFSSISPILQGFHMISMPLCLLINTSAVLLYFYKFVMRYSSDIKPKSDMDAKRQPRGIQRKAQIFRLALRRSPKTYFLMASIFAVLAIGFPILLDELCVCLFCDYGIHVFSDFDRLSSRVMRQYTIPDTCPPGPPCHVYTTLPEDGSKAVFINAHTNQETRTFNILYNELKEYKQTGNLKRKATPNSYKFDIEPKGDRYVHSVYIGGLKENTEYYFEIHYGENNQTLQYKNIFKTLPSKEMERDLVIVSGGDVSSHEIARNMTYNLASVKPDVIFIDGDAAYDDGMRSCYYSYDTFLNMFEELNKKLGYMVPLVIGVGNHDIGYNAPNQVVPPPADEGPLFFAYFPQHSEFVDKLLQSPGVPKLDSRKTYSYHLLGNTMHVSLDSAYGLGFEGNQSKWLDNLSSTYSGYHKFAHYHIPLYPSCEEDHDFSATDREVGIRAWVNTFEDYGYEGIFENHVHLMKKTHPLKQGKVHPDGVMYFGDGNWGVPSHGPHKCGNALDRSIFERVGNENHVWILNSTKSGWEYYPLGLEGKLMEIGYKEYRKEKKEVVENAVNK